MRIDALIFDVDGTLADTEEAHRVAFNLAFEWHGLAWHWQAAEYRELLKVGGGKERIRSYIDTLTVAGAERERLNLMVRDIHFDKMRLYSSVLRNGTVPLRAGVARLLDEALAQGCKLAIASTTTAVNIDLLLRSTLGPRGLDMFTVIACGDHVAHKKPAPDIYQLALRELDMLPAHAVAFEDSASGLHAATAAGLCTIVTPNFWTEDHDFSDAALVLPHLGSPDVPLPREPGRRLQAAAWLTCQDIERVAARHANFATQ
ncbi:HAD-IA family hydrolase [Variovorax sp. H27-G14]|uniref:HAD-IA family hydrolase n=1 Tax=Variovorax sp. H27-G14 TaxID=3111914 RepID=UPI0038FD1AC0